MTDEVEKALRQADSIPSHETADTEALRILGAEIRRLRTALAEIVETADLEPEDPDCGCARCLAGRALKAGRL